MHRSVTPPTATWAIRAPTTASNRPGLCRVFTQRHGSAAANLGGGARRTAGVADFQLLGPSRTGGPLVRRREGGVGVAARRGVGRGPARSRIARHGRPRDVPARAAVVARSHHRGVARGGRRGEGGGAGGGCRRLPDDSVLVPRDGGVGELLLEAAALRVTLDGKAVAVTSNEFALLWALAQAAGQVVTRDRLLDWTREKSDEVFDRSVDVNISRLRQKLGDDPRHPRLIKTVRGEGYLLAADTDRSGPV